MGIAKATPDSRMPRRFMTVKMATITIADQHLVGLEEVETAAPRFSTPEETETATVIT